MPTSVAVVGDWVPSGRGLQSVAHGRRGASSRVSIDGWGGSQAGRTQLPGWASVRDLCFHLPLGCQTRLWWPKAVGPQCPSEWPAWPEPDRPMTARVDHSVRLPETSSPETAPACHCAGVGAEL